VSLAHRHQLPRQLSLLLLLLQLLLLLLLHLVWVPVVGSAKPELLEGAALQSIFMLSILCTSMKETEFIQ
jgi:hypothetical protein